MAAPKGQPPERTQTGAADETVCRLRMRVAPEAIIIVTRQNRIVLVDSSAWSMEDFNRREIMEVIVPEGFQPAKLEGAAGSSEAAGLPVELIVGGSGAAREPEKESRTQPTQVSKRDSGRIDEISFVRHAQDAIVATAADYTVISWNIGAEKLYGYSSGELAGQPVSILIPPEIDRSEDRTRKRVLEGEGVAPYDSCRLAKDGSRREVSVSLSPIYDASGAIVGLLEIARDITNRRNAEREMASQISALTQSNRELLDYAQVVSHDLQAPLNLVSGYLSELAGRLGAGLDEDSKQKLAAACDVLPRMKNLIKELLELARLDGKLNPPARTDCAVLIKQVIADLEAPITESEARIIIVDPLPVVMADSTQLRQVFQNLLANALKFRSSRPLEIKIRAEMRAGEWRFSISDNGIGIDPGMIPRLFQPMQRLHASGPYSGTGLGLAIAKKVVSRHGGRIWAESQLEEGSTFCFSIPATEQNSQQDQD